MHISLKWTYVTISWAEKLRVGEQVSIYSKMTTRYYSRWMATPYLRNLGVIYPISETITGNQQTKVYSILELVVNDILHVKKMLETLQHYVLYKQSSA